MIDLRLSTVGDLTPARLAGKLYSLDRGLSDMRPAWPRVVEKIRKQEAARFSSENAQGPSGRWAALSPGYARWKARRFPGRGILYGPDRGGHKGGTLMRSLTSESEGSLIQYGERSLFVGTTVHYAGYHQRGTGRMPRRPPVDPSSRDVAELVAEIHRYVVAMRRGAFSGGRAAA